MIEEIGKVVAIDPLKSDKVWVETIRQSACNSCAAQKGCGHSMLEKIYEGQRNHVLAISEFDLSVGDQVVIGIPDDAVFKGSLMLYFVPILLLIAGVVLAKLLTAVSDINSDLLTGTGALIGLSVGLLVNRVYAKVNKDNVNFQPIVLRRATRSNISAAQLPCSKL